MKTGSTALRPHIKTTAEMRADFANELERLAVWFRDPERRDTELALALGLSVSRFGCILADYDSEVILCHVGSQIGQTVKALIRERKLGGG